MIRRAATHRRDRARGRTAGHRRGPRLTGRGAIAGMLLVFFIGVLVADWLHWSPLADASFLIGSAAAAWYTKQRDLLTVAVSPPLLFFIARDLRQGAHRGGQRR